MGLVAKPRARGITLTAKGEVEGARLVRRHRLSERFLAENLDMPWDEVHEEACKLEHVLSPEVEARLAEQLGNPRTCPHGHVIPDEDGALVDEDLRPLAELEPGESGVIGCISEEESALLRYLASLGLVPETSVAVEASRPSAGRCWSVWAGRSTRWAGRSPARSSCGADHMGVAARSRAAKPGPVGGEPKVAVCLAGNPNVGKSSLFNCLTGAAARRRTAPGSTTEACASRPLGRAAASRSSTCPAPTPSSGQGGDQHVAGSALLERRPDVVVAVVDATNLARSLYLPLQLLDLGYRVVVALNLVDEARRRHIDSTPPTPGPRARRARGRTVAPHGRGRGGAGGGGAARRRPARPAGAPAGAAAGPPVERVAALASALAGRGARCPVSG